MVTTALSSSSSAAIHALSAIFIVPVSVEAPLRVRFICGDGINCYVAFQPAGLRTTSAVPPFEPCGAPAFCPSVADYFSEYLTVSLLVSINAVHINRARRVGHRLYLRCCRSTFPSSKKEGLSRISISIWRLVNHYRLEICRQGLQSLSLVEVTLQSGAQWGAAEEFTDGGFVSAVLRCLPLCLLLNILPENLFRVVEYVPPETFTVPPPRSDLMAAVRLPDVYQQ